MQRTIIVAGHGPGISDAVARRFGREGFSVALVARNAGRVQEAAAALVRDGINAKAFAGDLGDAEAVRAIVRDVRGAFGGISVLHWNAFSGGAGDLLTARPEEIRSLFDVSVVGFLAAVQEALPSLTEAHGAVLVTGGGFAYYDPKVDAAIVSWGVMGLAVNKAAQHKMVGLLHHRLAKQGVYVGEITVADTVKGTQFDSGKSTLESATVAERLWEQYQARSEVWIRVP
jgi:NADP-dependent 3-hydroxy acid dehydrogenase YdfG